MSDIITIRRKNTYQNRHKHKERNTSRQIHPENSKKPEEKNAVLSDAKTSTKLSDAMWLHQIGSFMETKDCYALSQTSSYFYTLFKPGLDKQASSRLVSHVVRGKLESVIAMVTANPSLLTQKGTASDYSGRTFKDITPFQAALLTHDTSMWKKMQGYFQSCGGREEMIRQFGEIFPKGLPAQKPFDFSDIINAISRSSDNDIQDALKKRQNSTSVCKALNKFRERFAELSMQEIYFNPQHLISAHITCDKKTGRWDALQQDLFLRQIIGYIQRFVPACYAQIFCQGLETVVKEKKLTKRSFNFENSSSYYYPLSSPDKGLGFDFAVESHKGGWKRKETGPAMTDVGLLEKICKNNQKELRMLEDGIKPVAGLCRIAS